MNIFKSPNFSHLGQQYVSGIICDVVPTHPHLQIQRSSFSAIHFSFTFCFIEAPNKGNPADRCAPADFFVMQQSSLHLPTFRKIPPLEANEKYFHDAPQQ